MYNFYEVDTATKDSFLKALESFDKTLDDIEWFYDMHTKKEVTPDPDDFFYYDLVALGKNFFIKFDFSDNSDGWLEITIPQRDSAI
jgi:hypothetical protein